MSKINLPGTLFTIVMGKKDTGIAIPKIIWTDDLIWQLLGQIELPENRVVLFGKRKKGERTSSDSKVTAYQCIAAAILPHFHSLNAVAVGGHVKRKYEHLTKKYKELARRLRITGYVPACGPDETTTLQQYSKYGEGNAKHVDKSVVVRWIFGIFPKQDVNSPL
ncbi:hypothetical protein K503DRAFT_800842 [Rhizopogon vinicolor AM-OR11-026]|uniref:Uncharacterized protein n=1 Tax=Rhizopogon vinicolor AM-OR11-026 TaxID=1314800 RepID=A0A1B7MZ98_9AGAM|nr:hypothetical protein K503DRAFT_800842 [Rhizopogon vinicolor AM-OR11-026]